LEIPFRLQSVLNAGDTWPTCWGMMMMMMMMVVVAVMVMMQRERLVFTANKA